MRWPDQPGTYGHAKHSLTLEDASVKISWFGSIAPQAHTLQAAAGGVGIPVLHWFETVDDKEVMIMDMVGPTLEELFTKSGRYFGMCALLLFAEQMLARVEFIHSRNIYHGSLDPWSFALGSSGWQSQQALLVDFDPQYAQSASAQDDLYAVAKILAYFYGNWSSWDEYQHMTGSNIPRDTAPVICTFLHKASASRTVDYSALRSVFREANLDLATHLAIGLDLKGPRAICEGFNLDPGVFSTMDTRSLFETLNQKLLEAGKQVETLRGIATQSGYPQLLVCLDEIITIYGVLITRDRPSVQKERQAMGAYHLPNRLWRDLRWFMKSTDHERIEIRLALIEKIYKYIAVLYEATPSYQTFWTGYLLALARTRRDVEPGSGKPAWTQTVCYWQNLSNVLRAGDRLKE
ncbi:uncharacterized protein LDX57_001965 [Aspergillus melleus]|uniref:uncharacterized protein n=1 Tax=Aspergillus melleus TaxID=138277 RepID=UPI001E8DBC46|nr:uncharacterized protein LDX57_001965 [Aspergillus melleus]KAH8424208.1 hypothetical protein LDX57_001965 [Aspergillus melleus]